MKKKTRALVKKYTTYDFEPSAYQAELFDFVENGRGHIVVEAVAGSGKSTSLEHIVQLLSDLVLVCAFGKDIAKAMKVRLAHFDHAHVKTIYGVGFASVCGVLGKVDVDEYKYHDFFRAMTAALRTEGRFEGYDMSREEYDYLTKKGERDGGMPLRTLSRLLGLARLHLVSSQDELVDLVVDQQIDIDPVIEGFVFWAVFRAMRWGVESMKRDMKEHKKKRPSKRFALPKTYKIDYVDMVWLPAVLKLPARKTYSYVLVDECQDLSRAQFEIVRKCVRPGGRMIFVGDRKQSIFSFAGADVRSFENIVEKMEATIMPLSICYRCPRSHIEIAKTYCPQIEAAPWAEEGVVKKVRRGEVTQALREGDMVLCRMNAPLVSLCLQLIKEKIPAVVRGRSIAEGLVSIVTKIDKSFEWDDFDKGLEAWTDEQQLAIERRLTHEEAQEQAMEGVLDKVDCIKTIRGHGSQSFEELRRDIMDLFSDDRASIVLSSVHKAKGLENDRIFILEPDLLRHPRWGGPQEKNLAYVAFTRAKKELWFVEN